MYDVVFSWHNVCKFTICFYFFLSSMLIHRLNVRKVFLTRSLMLTNSYLEFPLMHCLANILFRYLLTGHWINNMGGVPNMYLSYLLWSLKECEDKGTNFWTQKLWLFTVERHCVFVAVDEGAINIINGMSTYFSFVNYKLGGCTRSFHSPAMSWVSSLALCAWWWYFTP